MPTLELLEFSDERVSASDLHDIVAASENEGLAEDFPTLRDRYGTLEDAQASVERVIDHGLRDLGGFAAYVVQIDGRTRGVITAIQERMTTGWSRTQHAEGPLVAYWLDERREPHERHVAVAAVQALARVIRDKPDMAGRAWTVVRPANSRSMRVLEDGDNGFGGFEPQGEPQRWNIGDGIRIPRQLYVARMTMGELRHPE